MIRSYISNDKNKDAFLLYNVMDKVFSSNLKIFFSDKKKKFIVKSCQLELKRWKISHLICLKKFNLRSIIPFYEKFRNWLLKTYLFTYKGIIWWHILECLTTNTRPSIFVHTFTIQNESYWLAIGCLVRLLSNLGEIDSLVL